jgi:FtsZ-binding cell division protein ZapB
MPPFTFCYRLPSKVIRSWQLGFFGLLFLSQLSHADTHGNDSTVKAQIEQIKNLTKEWVNVEKTRSKEQQNVREQQDNLEQLQEVLKQQLEEWKEKVANIEGNMSRSDTERHDLLEKKKSMAHARQTAIKFLNKIERQLKKLVLIIPTPLAKELEVPLRQLGHGFKNEQWLLRYQACLTIVKGFGAFHRRYTSSAQDIDIDGNKISVKVIYTGLSRAYFINLNGTKAGIGVPQSNGWLWKEQTHLSSEIKSALGIMEQNSTNLDLIRLPMELKK